MRRLILPNGVLDFERTRVMGIINVTPDSFSDGGIYTSVQDFSFAVKRMERDGADVIDIGGQSTRPGSARLSAQEEWSRLDAVLTAVCAMTALPISIDTYHPEVAKKAVICGASIINDVSGFESEEMRSVAAEYGCGCVVMHSEDISHRHDPVERVRDFFERRVEQCLASGIRRESICLDVGIGFGKTRVQDLELIRCMGQTRVHDLPILSALSRKRVIAYCLEQGGVELAPSKRDTATVAANTAAVFAGADMIRVHDVPSGYQCALVVSGIRNNYIG